MFALLALICFLVDFILDLSADLFDWADLGLVFVAAALCFGSWPVVLPWATRRV